MGLPLPRLLQNCQAAELKPPKLCKLKRYKFNILGPDLITSLQTNIEPENTGLFEQAAYPMV